jgi:hypothetical protein
MSLGQVIRHFEALGRVPVELPEVISEFRRIVIDERIDVHGLDISPDYLKGAHFRFRRPALPGSALVDEPIVKVMYSTQLDIGQQRLVCCKELIHVFDREPLLTNRVEEVVRLGHELANGKGKFSPKNDIKTTFDLLAKWQATAILFPFSLYETYLPAFQAGKVTIDQVAEWTQLPTDLVAVVMTDEWKALRESVLLMC